MKSAGKARNNGLYRHIRTSKEIIRNLLNDYHRMIKIENLTFSYPTSYDNVFENVSFQVDTDWKLGFVGRNGRGKTTFLNLLLGKYEYSGKILSSVQFDYFPYPVSDKNRITEDILQEICPLAEEWELMRELSYLDVDVDVLWRPFETLSNGEQTKVLIAALFLNEGHFCRIVLGGDFSDFVTRWHPMGR